MKDEMPLDGSKLPSIQYLRIIAFSVYIKRLCLFLLKNKLVVHCIECVCLHINICFLQYSLEQNLKAYAPVLIIPILHFHLDSGLPIEGDPPVRLRKSLLAKVVHIEQVHVRVSSSFVPGDCLGPVLPVPVWRMQI